MHITLTILVLLLPLRLFLLLLLLLFLLLVPLLLRLLQILPPPLFLLLRVLTLMYFSAPHASSNAPGSGLGKLLGCCLLMLGHFYHQPLYPKAPK